MEQSGQKPESERILAIPREREQLLELSTGRSQQGAKLSPQPVYLLKYRLHLRQWNLSSPTIRNDELQNGQTSITITPLFVTSSF